MVIVRLPGSYTTSGVGVGVNVEVGVEVGVFVGVVVGVLLAERRFKQSGVL
jgi:hypothetical protein